MFYKPKYCCNCGEEIIRSEWGIGTSRRFCDLCRTEHPAVDWIPRIAVAASLFFGALGSGGFFGGATGPVILRKNEGPRASPTPSKSGTDSDETSGPVGNSDPNTPAKAEWKCGAETRKGTLCTRKVSARGGRCWQHKGPS